MGGGRLQKAEAPEARDLPQAMQTNGHSLGPRDSVLDTCRASPASRCLLLPLEGEGEGSHLSGKQFTTESLKLPGDATCRKPREAAEPECPEGAEAAGGLLRWGLGRPRAPGGLGALNSPQGGFLGCWEGLVPDRMDLYPKKRQNSQTPPDGRAPRARGVPRLFFLSPFTTPRFVRRACATCQTPRKAVDSSQTQGSSFPGLRGPLALPEPSPSLHPELGRPAHAAVWPCTRQAPGLHAACSFCQNACPQMPAGTVLCRRS